MTINLRTTCVPNLYARYLLFLVIPCFLITSTTNYKLLLPGMLGGLAKGPAHPA